MDDVTPAAPTQLGLPLAGRRVVLERLGLRHLSALHELATTPGLAMGWPLLGVHVPEAAFAGHLAGLSRIQYAIVRRDSGDTVGLVQAVDDCPRSGVADLGLVLAEDLWRAGWPFEAVVLLADLLFRGMGYRKLYVSSPASTLRRLGPNVTGWLATECVLRDHVRVGDGYEDLTVLALRREDWDPVLVQQVTGRRAYRAD